MVDPLHGPHDTIRLQNIADEDIGGDTIDMANRPTRQVIEHTDGETFGNQSPDQVAADESATASDQNGLAIKRGFVA